MTHQPAINDLQPQARQAARFVKERLTDWPTAQTAIVTGSGLGALARSAVCHATLATAEIPGLDASADLNHPAVKGHGGRWHHAELSGQPVLILEGRRHVYEGISAAQAALPVAVLAHLGVNRLILTNAAGGLSPRLAVGDLMLLDDHINLMMRNPLIGPNDDPGLPRFPDMSRPYDPALGEAFERAALDRGIDLKRGVYAGLLGPNYETAAEVRMLRMMGADAVGMSTVPEVIAARQMGMHVAAVSLITNSHVASAQPPTHDEVLETGRRSAQKLATLLAEVMKNI